MQSPDLIILRREIYDKISLKMDLNKFPIKTYLCEFDKYPAISLWDYVSYKIKSLSDQIELDYGPEILGLYHKLILVELLIQCSNRKEINIQLAKVDQYYQRFFDQLIKRITNNENNSSFNYKLRRFRFEINICRGFIVPTVPQYINLHRASRSVIFKKNLKQFWKGLYYIAFKLKGTKPVFRLHTNSNDSYAMSMFSENGWRNLFVEIAEILRHNKRVKGVTGTAWFFDPQLELISPELAYINNLVYECNGLILYNGTDEKSTHEAIFMNKSRREKFQNGSYQPTKYTVYISRDELIQWSIAFRNIR